MAHNDFSAESPENPEEKCTCALVLDTSGSMSGSPINELNDGVERFLSEIEGDPVASDRLEVSVITFDSKVDTAVEPALVHNISMPTLKANGSTKLVDGVREGIDKVEARKNWYKQTGQPHKRPWVILITDGSPDSGQDVDGLAKDISDGMNSKHFHFFAVGVKGANMGTLQQLSSDTMQPAKLEGLKFGEFFKWLSNSLGQDGITGAEKGEEVTMADGAQDWMAGGITVD